MEIICSTTYDRRALSALARALRKTIRRTRSRLLRVWCWVLLVLSLLSAWVSWGEWGTVALNGAVAVLMLAVLLGRTQSTPSLPGGTPCRGWRCARCAFGGTL